MNHAQLLGSRKAPASVQFSSRCLLFSLTATEFTRPLHSEPCLVLLMSKVILGICFYQVCEDAQFAVTKKKNKNKKMKQLHGILFCCCFNMFVLLCKLWQIKCVLLTMQSLFMMISVFKLWISVVRPLLV